MTPMCMFNYKNISKVILFAGLVCSNIALAQSPTDSIKTNQNGIYNRPFIDLGKTRTAVGGYLEGNTNYFAEDGVSEGFSMELRRFNIFLYSQIHPKIKFLSELEFEHGTEEIALETALIDVNLLPALNFRAGILLPNIGLVNTNHDSPNWEFVERPLSSTQLIPSTLSEVGFGLYGRFYPNEKFMLTYDAYVVNGLQDNIVLNSEGRTFIPAGKNEQMFGEDNNGTPMINLHTSIANRSIGEIGFGYYGGVYNSYMMEGEQIAPKRSLHLMALDYNINFNNLTLLGEFVWASIDVPENTNEIYGGKQRGGFTELQIPLLKRKILSFESATLKASIRYEYIDYNKGKFRTNISSNIGDEIRGLAVGLGFRPASGTIIRANYIFQNIHDALGNPPAKLGGFQFGFATYF
jgi:hypothetical protein